MIYSTEKEVSSIDLHESFDEVVKIDFKEDDIPAVPAAQDNSYEPETEELPLKEEETALKIVIPSKVRSTKKRKKQLRSVLEMLREYEEEDARNIPKIETQLMLNLDDATDSLVETKIKK